MMVTGEFAQERRELDRVLTSGIFDRAPSLAQVLTYVCEKYFEGTAQDLKEYNIAIDALGRTADFDQKKDSIVRVQMHRLRERLAEFYSKDGSDHPIVIEIPQGQYVPSFVIRQCPGVSAYTSDPLPVTAPAPTPSPAVAPPAPVSATAAVSGSAPSQRPIWALAGMAAAFALIAIFVFRVSSPGKSTASAAPAVAPAAAAATDSVHILVGLEKGTYTDGFGRVWEADRNFEGGSIVKIPERPIRGTREPKLYQNRRQGNFSYHIPLNPGTYELRLHFAEVHFGETNLAGLGGEGSRNFGIEINGKPVLEKLDVMGEAGPGTAHIRTFRNVSPAADGKAHIVFIPKKSEPFVNAIEITQGTPGKLLPIRMAVQDRPYTDPQGRVWMPDRVAMGGRVAQRAPLESAQDPLLFSGERFGNFSYLIPVAPGRYALTLYMAERWRGPGMPGGDGGIGSRVFDIMVNGSMLARDFDVYKRVGGPDRPLVQTFHGLEPNHQGYLSISLVPNKAFPIVSALEVTDESR